MCLLSALHGSLLLFSVLFTIFASLYEFFDAVSKEKDWNVVSAGGKSNIFKFLKENAGKSLVIIADGAAFGPEMDRVMKEIPEHLLGDNFETE